MKKGLYPYPDQCWLGQTTLAIANMSLFTQTGEAVVELSLKVQGEGLEVADLPLLLPPLGLVALKAGPLGGQLLGQGRLLLLQSHHRLLLVKEEIRYGSCTGIIGFSAAAAIPT